jgi:hypothetical protein
MLLLILPVFLFKQASRERGVVKWVQWIVAIGGSLWLSNRVIPVPEPVTWRTALLWAMLFAAGAGLYLLAALIFFAFRKFLGLPAPASL